MLFTDFVVEREIRNGTLLPVDNPEVQDRALLGDFAIILVVPIVHPHGQFK